MKNVHRNSDFAFIEKKCEKLNIETLGKWKKWGKLKEIKKKRKKKLKIENWKMKNEKRKKILKIEKNKIK